MSGIYRTVKNKEYFHASNEPFNDERLSWEARGVIGYLLSKPDGWECRNYDLLNKGPSGEHKLKRILAELRQYGYLRRYRVHADGGRFDWVTEIYESPKLNPTIGRFSTNGSPTDGSPTDGKPPCIDKTDLDKTDLDKTEEEAPPPPKKENGKYEPWQLLARQVAVNCKHDLKLLRNGSLKKVSQRCDIAGQSLAEIGATVDNLKDHAEWWYKNDWRGKQKEDGIPGSPPTPEQILETWGQFKNGCTSNGNGRVAAPLTPAQMKRAEQIRQEDKQ